MTTFSAIKLQFQTPLHLSHGRQDYSEGQHWLPSDTLSAALVASAIELFGDTIVSDNAEGFMDSFRVSSAFPYFDNEYFFPRPLLNPLQMDDQQQNKARKRVIWYGKSWFEEWLNNSGKAFTLDDLSEKNRRFLTGNKTVRETEFISTHVEQRVQVPRWSVDDEAESLTFYQERIYFHADAGLFFLYEIRDEKWRPTFEAALKLLGANGIGTDRNNGNGLFSFKMIDLPMQLPDPANTIYHISLSLFCPKKEEIDLATLETSGYQLIQRGGYIASPAIESHMAWRKKSVWMFREGSVFPRPMEGKFVNLKPEKTPETVTHPIWRDGRFFSI